MHVNGPMKFRFPSQTLVVLNELRCIIGDVVEHDHSLEIAQRCADACSALHELGPLAVADLLGQVLALEGAISEAQMYIHTNWVMRMQQAVDVMDGVTMQSRAGYDIFRESFRELNSRLGEL